MANKREILSGIASLLVAGATIFAMEKTGLPSASQELREASTKVYWGDVPVAGNYFPRINGSLSRIGWDGIPAAFVGLLTYSALSKRRDE